MNTHENLTEEYWESINLRTTIYLACNNIDKVLFITEKETLIRSFCKHQKCSYSTYTIGTYSANDNNLTTN